MKLKLVRHLWGVNRNDYDTLFKELKDFGYEAIETPLPKDSEPFVEALAKYQLEFIPQLITSGDGKLTAYIEDFTKRISELAKLKPLKVVVHDGRDAFSIDEARTYFKETLAVEKELSFPVARETHRGRIFFHPWITRDLLGEFPELKLCCDFSHWVNVCERLIEDQIEIIELCAQHTEHVHARVGYEEGPQVPDPRAPEYARHLEAHETWWDIIWKTQQSQGVQVSTLTPEFGPQSYLHTLPFTNVPVANLWDVCNWQASRQKDRFESVISS